MSVLLRVFFSLSILDNLNTKAVIAQENITISTNSTGWPRYLFMIGDSIGPYITKDQNPTAKGMPMINEIDVPAREVVLGFIESVIKSSL